MREIKKIYIHESESKYGNALLINWWHKLQGFGTSIINRFRDNNDESFVINNGYHIIISNGFIYNSREKFSFMDGNISFSRPLDTIGAAVYGDNKTSVHICLIKNGGEPTYAQWKSLYDIVLFLIKKYSIPVEDILGHCEYYSNKGLKIKKLCPRINMNDFRKTIRSKMEENVKLDEKEPMTEVPNSLLKAIIQMSDSMSRHAKKVLNGTLDEI